MENFVYESTLNTPKVKLTTEPLYLLIEGVSKPINALSFYDKIIDWLDNNQGKFTNSLKCEFYFESMNTASQKMVYDILKKLESIHRYYNGVSILWKYDSNNIDIKEVGEDISRIVDIPFSIVDTQCELA